MPFWKRAKRQRASERKAAHRRKGVRNSQAVFRRFVKVLETLRTAPKSQDNVPLPQTDQS